jgi:caffeoyl-CoA O-methyltransferase
MKRREFLRTTTGAAGLATFATSISLMQSFASEQAAPRNKEALDKLMAAMEAKGRRMLSVPREDGKFLSLMVKSSRAKNILEVGTSQGYSALWMCLGLEETGGNMVTIDIDPEKVRLARENVAKGGFSDRVTFKEGNAHQIIPALGGPFDFVFLDADKDGQMNYFKLLYPNKLVPGGIIAVHNAIHSRASMRDYLDMISQHRDFDSVTLSLTMDDGFSVSYRKRLQA